jgi:hypothetical protein
VFWTVRNAIAMYRFAQLRSRETVPGTFA